MLLFPQKRRMESHESIRFCISRRKPPWNLFKLIVQKRWASAKSWWDMIYSHQEQQFSLLLSSPKICMSSLPPSTVQSSAEILWNSPTQTHPHTHTHTPFSIKSPGLSGPSSILPLLTSLSPQHLPAHTCWIFCAIITKFNFALRGSGS